jgi:hypothetical protein
MRCRYVGFILEVCFGDVDDVGQEWVELKITEYPFPNRRGPMLDR